MSNKDDERQLETVRSADGTPIAYLRLGEGPPIVLVHGALMDRDAWNAVSPFLRDSFTLHAIDRRGRGASGDTTPYAVEREIEDIAAVLESVGEPCDLAGHSSGAVLALMTAERGLPLRRLVLYEPPIILPGQRPSLSLSLSERLTALVEAGERQAAVRLFLKEGPLWPESQIDELLAAEWRRQALINLSPTAAYDARIVAAYEFDPERLRSLRLPVLLLLGEKSPEWLRAGMEALKDSLPQAQLVTLAGQGHLALQTAPEQVAREITQFLSGS